MYIVRERVRLSRETGDFPPEGGRVMGTINIKFGSRGPNLT